MISLSRRSSTTLLRMRCFSTSANDLGSEFLNTKPFEAIPSPSILSLISRGFPGGKYHKKSINEITEMLFEEYGPIYRLGGMLGNPDIVMTSNANDFEKVIL